MSSSVTHKKEVVLVTGGAGYVGTATVARLKQAGLFPVVLDWSKPTEKIELLHGVPCVWGDVRNKKTLQRLFDIYQPATVVHLAAITAPSTDVTTQDLLSKNCESDSMLLTVMREYECRQLIYASSAAVFGNAKNIVDETTKPSPISAYGCAKFATEQLIQKAVEDQQLCAVVLRYFNVAGAIKHGWPHSRANSNGLFFALREYFLRNIQHISLYGNHAPTQDGSSGRDYVHLRDVIEANYKAVLYLLQSKKSVMLHIASGTTTTVLEVVAEFEQQSGQNVNIVFEAAKENEGLISQTAIDKARQVLRWSPQYSTTRTIMKDFIANITSQKNTHYE